MYQGEITPDQLLDLFGQRQSDRSFENRPIEPEKLSRILEAARLAPSACNAQPWRYIVVDDAELKNKIADTTSHKLLPVNHFTKQAPVIIAIVEERANLSSRFGTAVKGVEFPPFDIGLSLGQLCLQAAVEGLGTCIIGWFDPRRVRQLLSIPENKRVPLLVVVGYPKGSVRKKNRKALSEIHGQNRY